MILSSGLLALWVATLVGYNLWYWLALGEWQDRVRAAGYRVGGSSGYMPDGSGVHRGGQFLPHGVAHRAAVRRDASHLPPLVEAGIGTMSH